jgi:alpha 1,2-mannosyltransferase
MSQNPFEIIQSKNIVYLSSAIYKEGRQQTEGLWETFLRFAVKENLHPAGLFALSNPNDNNEYTKKDLYKLSVKEAAIVLLDRGYNLDYIYNNWEVSRTEIWRSKIYEKLALFIEESGGIFMRRWGDAPIRTMALHLLQDYYNDKGNFSFPYFQQYKGLRYFHKAIHFIP